MGLQSCGGSAGTGGGPHAHAWGCEGVAWRLGLLSPHGFSSFSGLKEGGFLTWWLDPSWKAEPAGPKA